MGGFVSPVCSRMDTRRTGSLLDWIKEGAGEREIFVVTGVGELVSTARKLEKFEGVFSKGESQNLLPTYVDLHTFPYGYQKCSY